MSLGSNTTNDKYVFKNDTIVPSAEEHVPLGITINSRLSFYSRLKQLCKKVANKRFDKSSSISQSKSKTPHL